MHAIFFGSWPSCLLYSAPSSSRNKNRHYQEPIWWKVSDSCLNSKWFLKQNCCKLSRGSRKIMGTACNHLCSRTVAYRVKKTDYSKNNQQCQMIDFSSDGKLDMSDLPAWRMTQYWFTCEILQGHWEDVLVNAQTCLEDVRGIKCKHYSSSWGRHNCHQIKRLHNICPET